ncbi:SDR family NAD(P)-dependent oxidoreductase [Altererythrobacter xixiisoli]|uniref:SDR family NAD(P)-dependent oxidoreductase n=1 Tax=Croceibacterium xixiisoli TaxID=1476466 RepID=A0A6I4TXI9_9SPHN|nr:SDR family oxidoreductase [Croceibacterium xixiisoli]MXP00715.1 SDR family NAD(P)-dependent oxidoreductase [Croceibacterium xixiisoli]
MAGGQQDGRVGLITGAGSGIGRAAALALAARGYRLVLVGRRSAVLEETAALAGDIPTLVAPCDVADEAAVDALFAQAVDHFGRIDLLFNNAGLALPATPIEDLALTDWRRLVDVNTTGAFLCLRAAFRVMKDQDPQGGRIINNGSLSAHVPRLFSAAYTATKHAITGLTRSGSLEGRRYNIACGQIDIGNAATDLGGGVMDGALQADGSRRAEPLMDVTEAGEAVAYMDSLPLSTNVQFMTVMASAMPFIGRG